MRGHKFYSFPAFDAAEERLRRLGYDVVNPAYLDRMRGIHPESFPDDWDWNDTPEGFDLKAVALTCIQHISECDGVLALYGWESSKGASAETCFACWIGIDLIGDWVSDSAILICFGDPQ